MKAILTGLISLLFLNYSVRIEMNYDQSVKELQIKVDGLEKLEHVKIYEGKTLLVQFYQEQVPPWDQTLRLKINCPDPARFTYEVTLKDGRTEKVTGKKSNLLKNGSFCEIQ